MKAVAVIEPNRVEIIEVDRPAPGPYQAVVRTAVAALCNATDRKLIEGHFPGVDHYPLVLGHESAGVVEEVGEKVRNFKPGDTAIGGLLFEFSDPDLASGWGGFCQYILVNDHDAMVDDGVAAEQHGWFECYEIQRTIDPDIPLQEAVLLCTWREVYGAFGDFHLQSGDDILIFGAGPVGLSFVKFARLLGLGWVGVVEPNTDRHVTIRRMGADDVFVPDELSLVKQSRPALDAVVDAVGDESIVGAALPFVKMGGSICIYGVLAGDTIRVEKSLGPYNFNLFVHQWPTRWREREAQAPLCEWIRQGKLKAAEFVTHEFPVERINHALDAGKSGQVVKCLLRF